jgi:hypothetical protein
LVIDISLATATLTFIIHLDPPHPLPLKIAGVAAQTRFIGIMQL